MLVMRMMGTTMMIGAGCDDCDGCDGCASDVGVILMVDVPLVAITMDVTMTPHKLAHTHFHMVGHGFRFQTCENDMK